MEWYLKVLRQYADFSGRARRKEFWMFVLFNLLFSFMAVAIDHLLGFNYIKSDIGLLNSLYSLAVLVPSLAVIVRRLHDTGRSGWKAFFVLIPIAGIIILLLWLTSDSEYETNEYGVNPKR